jgi:type IV fimbrial biogenesis protein FimT
MRMRRSHGVTLIELVTTIGIVAILASVAGPSFSDARHNAERTSTVNSFLHGLFLARSEAIKRGEVVTVCRSSDGSTCALSKTSQWQTGWMIFVNKDRDEAPQRDANEDVLLVHEGWSGGTISSNRGAYSFRPYQQGVVNGTIVFCDPRGSDYARAIIISHTGRPRVAQRDASNRPLRCASQ